MPVDPIANLLRTATRPARRVAAGAPGPLARLWAAAVDALERRRAARLVAEMDDRMLRDIGIHRGDAMRAIRHGREERPRPLPWWTR